MDLGWGLEEGPRGRGGGWSQGEGWRGVPGCGMEDGPRMAGWRMVPGAGRGVVPKGRLGGRLCTWAVAVSQSSR